MSADAAVLVRSFRVGRRTCMITFPPFRRSAVKSVECTRRLSARQMREYRAGRNRAIAELAGMAS